MESQQETEQVAQSVPEPVSAPETARRVERLPGVHLTLKVGSQLLLRVLCVDKRYEGTVVGLEPYAYSIVRVRLPQDTLARLGQNPGVVAQLNSGGMLFGFRADVLNRVSVPAPLLFLSHPDSVERLVLRRSERMDVTLPCTVHGAFGDHEVVLLDLAPTGCSFAARSSLKSPLRMAQPGERLVLRCDLGFGHTFTVPLALRRVDEQKGRITMGGQFEDMNEESSRLLSDYLQRMQGLLG
jgi:hypothetical protein